MITSISAANELVEVVGLFHKKSVIIKVGKEAEWNNWLILLWFRDFIWKTHPFEEYMDNNKTLESRFKKWPPDGWRGYFLPKKFVVLQEYLVVTLCMIPLEPRKFKNNLTMFESKLILKLPASFTHCVGERKRWEISKKKVYQLPWDVLILSLL